MMGGSFKKLFAKIEQALSYKKEKAKINFTLEIQKLMEKQGVTRAELARGLNKSGPYVTQILRGERNFTIETMVEVAEALNSNLAIHFSPKSENVVDWYMVVQKAPGKRRNSVRASAARFQKMRSFDPEDYINDTNKKTLDDIHGNENNGYPVAA